MWKTKHSLEIWKDSTMRPDLQDVKSLDNSQSVQKLKIVPKPEVKGISIYFFNKSIALSGKEI